MISLCDYSDSNILVKGTNTADDGAAVNDTNKKAKFKNCAAFTCCITEINNVRVDNAEDVYIVMPMYNLIEYSNAYSKTSGSLWQYYRHEPALDTNGNIIDCPDNNNNNNSFKFKQQITKQIGNGGTKNIEIMVPLKYLSNFWKTHEIPLITSKVTLQQTCSKKSIIIADTAANEVPKFKMTDTNPYVFVVTVSTEDNIKLLKQLELGFKRKINWNEYHSQQRSQAQDRHLNVLIDTSFQRVNRLFVL